MDVIGMRAVVGIARAFGMRPPENLRTTTFAADIVTNSLYYSMVAAAGAERALAAGAALGAVAGMGGVLLPPPMPLGDEEVNRTRTTQALVILMYLARGLIAAATYRSLV